MREGDGKDGVSRGNKNSKGEVVSTVRASRTRGDIVTLVPGSPPIAWNRGPVRLSVGPSVKFVNQVHRKWARLYGKASRINLRPDPVVGSTYFIRGWVSVSRQ